MEQPTHDDDRDASRYLADLLREAGPREVPEAGRAAEVRRHVHAEWCAVVEAQRRARPAPAAARSRWPLTMLAAAAVALLAIGVWLGLSPPTATAPPVATLVRIAGEVQVDERRVAPTGAGTAVVRAGQTLATSPRARVALALGEHVMLRVDEDSRLRFESPVRAVLLAGAVYVDVAAQGAGQPLEIASAKGVVRHLGTRYQVRQAGASVEIAVRDGRVVVEGSAGTHGVAAGELLVMAGAGRVSRMVLPGDDPRWAWIHAATPAFDIGGRPLSEFLDWASRELGRELRYATPADRDHAARVMLRGSIDGLVPEASLAAVLATTTFEYRLVPGVLEVGR